MSWRAQGNLGALGVLMTLCLTLLLASGQAPYDWAWSRGRHATPAQWRAHERYEQRGAAHHGPTDSVGAEQKATTEPGAQVKTLAGTWLEDGTHDAHAAAPDGVQARVDAARQLRPAPMSRRLSSLPAPLPSAPSLSPPVQPPRFIS